MNGINHALGGSYNPCSYKICPGGGGGGGVCEWYKTCPAGTTNHILGVVY